MSSINYNSEFACYLNNIFSLIEDHEIHSYLRFHIGFLKDEKSLMINYQVKIRKLIIDMLNGFEFSVGRECQETGEISNDKVINGKTLVNNLKKSKWNNGHIIAALYVWNENINELFENTTSFSSDEILCDGAKKAMSIKTDLKELSRYFIQNDILTQLIKQA